MQIGERSKKVSTLEQTRERKSEQATGNSYPHANTKDNIATRELSKSMSAGHIFKVLGVTTFLKHCVESNNCASKLYQKMSKSPKDFLYNE